MKPLLYFCCILAALGAGVARAGIVLDDAPQDSAPAPAVKPIAVPKPSDARCLRRKIRAGDPICCVLQTRTRCTVHSSPLTRTACTGRAWMRKTRSSSRPRISPRSNSIPTNPRPMPRPPTQAVTLTNNDELPGTLVSMDDKSLVLDTWYAGKITIPRDMVKGITPLKTGEGTLYEGPTGLDGWTLGQQRQQGQELELSRRRPHFHQLRHHRPRHETAGHRQHRVRSCHARAIPVERLHLLRPGREHQQLLHVPDQQQLHLPPALFAQRHEHDRRAAARACCAAR